MQHEIKKIQPKDTWPIRHVVMWPQMPFDFVKVEGDLDGQHFGLFQGSMLVSVVSCFWTGGEMQFRKFATLHAFQGQGLGTQLLRYMLDDATARGAKRIWCRARTQKTGFYKRFGFTVFGSPFETEGVSYVYMELFPELSAQDNVKER